MASAISKINPTSQLQNNPGLSETYGNPLYMVSNTATPSAAPKQNTTTNNGSYYYSPFVSSNVKPYSTLSGSTGSTGTNNNTNVFTDASNAAQSQNDALLSSLNTQFDQTSAQLNNQLGYLGTQKDNSLNELNTAFSGVENQAKNQKTASQTNTDNAISQAGSVAQSTQLQNRNILRALGILNSSAGGDLLSKPINEFDKQRASLVAAHLQRINELDDALNQAASQHANAVKSLEDNYSNLVGQIQTDLRFNDRQRADAIKSANAALQQRLSDIQTSLFNYKTQVDAAKANSANTISSIANYTSPTADLSAFQAIDPGAAKASGNAQIYDPNYQKKNQISTGTLLSDINSGALSF